MASTPVSALRYLPAPPQHGYSVLLAALLMLMLLGPLAEDLGRGKLAEAALVSVVLVAGLYAISHRRGLALPVLLMGLFTLMVNWLLFVDVWDRASTIYAEVTGILFFGAIGLLVLQDVMSRAAKVNTSLINGALSVYLLAGLAFAYAMSLVSTLQPGAFNGADVHAGDRIAPFEYLSFVTLASLGYGDLTPQSQLARSLCTLEAVFGQIFMTVLVARLVGVQINLQAIGTAPSPPPVEAPR